ncbi:hypothetical protein nbrc107697_00440 [Gordonia crocea]|uniref:DUF5318 domain-containing protein n=2 Tax=Gordonia crocea TaxID=589162 RepID=A0A7M4BQ44_9ACTN|nr:hypothetical protein nbrc107697_00440 [Gordonia crocea]
MGRITPTLTDLPAAERHAGSLVPMAAPSPDPATWGEAAARQVVDYSLRRRARLAEVNSGRIGIGEVCDANPYLLTAAEFHGAPSDISCPICRKENLTLVSWVFGDRLGQASGSARSAAELEQLARKHTDFSVHVVEVCRSCHWNHLVRSYVSGLKSQPTRTRKMAK